MEAGRESASVPSSSSDSPNASRDAGSHGVRAPLERDRGGVRHLARDGAAARLPLPGAHLSAFRVVAFLRRRFGACSLGFVLKRS